MKYILITGTNSSISKTTCEFLLKKSYRIFGSARDKRNAVIVISGALKELATAAFKKPLDFHLVGTFMLTKAFRPLIGQMESGITRPAKSSDYTPMFAKFKEMNEAKPKTRYYLRVSFLNDFLVPATLLTRVFDKIIALKLGIIK